MTLKPCGRGHSETTCNCYQNLICAADSKVKNGELHRDFVLLLFNVEKCYQWPWKEQKLFYAWA